MYIRCRFIFTRCLKFLYKMDSLFIYICKVSANYSDVIMSVFASQITGVSIVYWTICSGADQRIHQSSASLAFVRRDQRWPVNSPHKGPITRKRFPLDDVIMLWVKMIHIWMITNLRGQRKKTRPGWHVLVTWLRYQITWVRLKICLYLG